MRFPHDQSRHPSLSTHPVNVKIISDSYLRMSLPQTFPQLFTPLRRRAHRHDGRLALSRQPVSIRPVTGSSPCRVRAAPSLREPHAAAMSDGAAAPAPRALPPRKEWPLDVPREAQLPKWIPWRVDQSSSAEE